MAIFSDSQSNPLKNILVRLPPESLGQFKTVSKSWNALISSHKFIKSHLNHSIISHKISSNVLTIKRMHDIHMVEFSITGDNLSEDFVCSSKLIIYLPELLLDDRTIEDIVGSSNGLLCLLLSTGNRFDKVFSLCNPLTKKTWDLPGGDWKSHYRTYHSLSGFWYDAVHDDYQVVILNNDVFNKGILGFQCHVYSLRSNSWRRVDSYLDYVYNEFIVPSNYHQGGVLVNSAFHWIIRNRKSMAPVILSLDLRTYEPTILPSPEIEGDVFNSKLTALNGYLVIGSHSRDAYSLWTMKGDSWTRMSLHKIHGGDSLRPLALVEKHKRILISYDYRNDMLELHDLDNLDNVRSVRHLERSFLDNAKLEFVGSLVEPYPPSVDRSKNKVAGGDRSVNKASAAGDSLFKKKILSDTKFFDKFHIHVNGVSINSELPEDVRRKYYELCCLKKSFLHEQFALGVTTKLATRMISETVKIADSMRSCEFSTASRKKIEQWGESLRSFELLGMNVGFLRDGIRCLVTMAFDSEEAAEANEYWEVKSRKAQTEKEIGKKQEDIEKSKQEIGKKRKEIESLEKDIKCVEKDINKVEEKVVQLKEEGKKYDAEMDTLKPKLKSYELKFREEIRKLMS